MTRPTNPTAHASTRLRTPNNNTFDGLQVENALLLRRLLMLITREAKTLAALELATGVPWDDVNLTDMSGAELEEYVAQELAHGIGITIEDARTRVARNKALANPNQVEVPFGQESDQTLEGYGEKPKLTAVERVVPTINGNPATS